MQLANETESNVPRIEKYTEMLKYEITSNKGCSLGKDKKRHVP